MGAGTSSVRRLARPHHVTNTWQKGEEDQGYGTKERGPRGRETR
jgi:hypothetical protein